MQAIIMQAKCQLFGKKEIFFSLFSIVATRPGEFWDGDWSRMMGIWIQFQRPRDIKIAQLTSKIRIDRLKIAVTEKIHR